MNTSLLSQNMRRAVEEAIQIGRIPGMVVAVARGQAPVEYLAIGADALGRPLAHDALFPVASITKLATALAVLRLAEDGALTLDDQLSEWARLATPMGGKDRGLFFRPEKDDEVLVAHEQGDPTRPVLIRVETKAGHGAGKPVSKLADELADELTFLLHELGTTP